MNKKIILLLLIFIVGFGSAIPQSFTVNGRLGDQKLCFWGAHFVDGSALLGGSQSKIVGGSLLCNGGLAGAVMELGQQEDYRW